MVSGLVWGLWVGQQGWAGRGISWSWKCILWEIPCPSAQAHPFSSQTLPGGSVHVHCLVEAATQPCFGVLHTGLSLKTCNSTWSHVYWICACFITLSKPSHSGDNSTKFWAQWWYQAFSWLNRCSKWRGPHTRSRSSRMLFSATAGPQLGGFQFCVADLKQEIKNLPDDGTKKRRENNSWGSCMAGCTAVSSTDLAAQWCTNGNSLCSWGWHP